MFEFLFKYPAADFAAGRFVSLLDSWQWLLLPLAAALAVFILFGTFRLRARTRLLDRAALALLRGGALAVLAFSLSQPLLEVRSRTPQPGVVGVLVDNSLSMQLADTDDGTRADFVRAALDAADGDLLAELRRRYDPRLFAYGAETRRVEDLAALDFTDGASNLAQALASARAALAGEPLAGLVIIGDGAAAGSAALDEQLLALRADGIPVYPVGVGETRYRRDLEISRVSLPKRVLNGSRVTAEVALRQQGYAGETVEILVEDDSRILHKQTVTLAADEQSVSIPLATDEAGARRLEFSVTPRDGEQLGANNRRAAALAVDNRRLRVLYYEGEPRFEMKFVRRAVAADDNLGVTGLIRTADAKYYRVGVDNRAQLRDGFPNERDELFAYDALILGSVDITLLTRAQQQMIVDFVSERGGGLLLLGGRRAFSEGGYRDSLLHAISPVVMPAQARPDFSRSSRILPTDAAWVHPALQLADSREDSIARWQTLPPLDIVNPIRQLKPGATLLLAASAAAEDEPLVAMAWQRYGRGRVVAFPVQNSWLWQMHHEIELEDQSHERLWRQLLRWLVESVPQRLELTLSAQSLPTGGTLRLRAEALGADFTPLTDGELVTIVTAPDGSEQSLPMAPHPTLPGIYEASLRVTASGDYRAQLELGTDEQILRGAENRFSAAPAGDEHFASELDQALLQRIADETGGRYFAAEDAGSLPGALDNSQRGAWTLARHELWDMPILFLLLATLLSIEWAWRRWRGLP
ncbi:MAG: hypothetical protein QNJ85_18430 [Gammaproteobacteria bacterium]|nr:hypothetical protein [Gammaproteobacteria bacterium]